MPSFCQVIPAALQLIINPYGLVLCLMIVIVFELLII